MSYDLMVFDPAAAPTTHAEFMAWYREQAEWDEDHGYDDPAVSTPALRAWFLEMIPRFPAMNGPHADRSRTDDNPAVTDYSIGRKVIYCAFAWSKAGEAGEAVAELAGKHGVGFFDASSDRAEVWLPVEGELVLTLQG